MLAEDSLNCDTAVSVSAPSVPHRGFLVEFLHIHFQERFMGGHLNTARDTSVLPSSPGFTATG